MPTLRHLVEELRKIDVNSTEIRILGQLYDDLIGDAEDIAEENSQGSEKKDSQNKIRTAEAIFPTSVMQRLGFTITLLNRHVVAIVPRSPRTIFRL